MPLSPGGPCTCATGSLSQLLLPAWPSRCCGRQLAPCLPKDAKRRNSGTSKSTSTGTVSIFRQGPCPAGCTPLGEEVGWASWPLLSHPPPTALQWDAGSWELSSLILWWDCPALCRSSNTWAGHRRRFLAGRVVVAISKDEFLRDPHTDKHARTIWSQDWIRRTPRWFESQPKL